MNFIVKRLLWSIPTLLAIVLVGFVLLVYTPGDPVKTVLHLSDSDDPLKPVSPNIEKQKREWEDKLGLNLPLFYFTIQSGALPSDLYEITNKKEQNTIRALCLKTGDSQQVFQYRRLLDSFHLTFLKDVKSIPANEKDSYAERIAELTSRYNTLLYETDLVKIKNLQGGLVAITYFGYFKESYRAAIRLQDVHLESGNLSKVFIPSIQFHSQSRFHQWLFGDGKYSKGILRGDFGISYVSQEPITNHIYKNLFWSVLFSGFGIIMAYLISIPIGIRSAIHNNSFGERLITVFLFILYAIPVFFMGTLLQTFLANNQYLHIFEPTGIQPIRGFKPNSNLIERIWQSLPYMILPIICFTYSSIAFLTKLTKTAVLETLNQPYIQTAKAKGLPFKTIIYKHAFRNALIPLITVFANIFPVLVGGSVIVETIFTIPGMGTEMFSSYFSNNIPVIISIFTLTGIFTVVGFFISDILYLIVDPRIRK